MNVLPRFLVRARYLWLVVGLLMAFSQLRDRNIFLAMVCLAATFWLFDRIRGIQRTQQSFGVKSAGVKKLGVQARASSFNGNNRRYSAARGVGLLGAGVAAIEAMNDGPATQLFDDVIETDSSDMFHEVGTGQSDLVINPATGLPMINGFGGIDVGGNPFGIDLNSNWNDSLHGGSAFDDSWSSGSLFDDSWSSSSSWDDS